jgi:hypothetical protein
MKLFLQKENTMRNSDFGILGGIILLVVVLLFLSPFISIWSINTLFGTNISINLWTYLAALWLTGLVAGTKGGSK